MRFRLGTHALAALLVAAITCPGDPAYAVPKGKGSSSSRPCKMVPTSRGPAKQCGAGTNGGPPDTPGDAPNGTPDEQDQCFLNCTGHKPPANQTDHDICAQSCYSNAH
jgi:hypothetical protein